MLLKDRKVIVTCGPTREWLDPVRFISNPSTGKMGIAIADEASSVCRETVLIHGPINEILLEDKTIFSRMKQVTDSYLWKNVLKNFFNE